MTAVAMSITSAFKAEKEIKNKKRVGEEMNFFFFSRKGKPLAGNITGSHSGNVSSRPRSWNYKRRGKKLGQQTNILH